jgi:hypothetical protein
VRVRGRVGSCSLERGSEEGRGERDGLCCNSTVFESEACRLLYSMYLGTVEINE